MKNQITASISDINLAWSLPGIKSYESSTDVFIIVDILSFSTCIDIAVGNNTEVYPYPYKDDSAVEFAKSKNAILASSVRSEKEYSLSPSSLLSITKGTKIVLPSPNGSALSLATGSVTTLCGSLRNAKAVADHALTLGKRITIIPAGEKFSDGSLRYADEDLLGAGAILSCMNGNMSPECNVAVSFFESRKYNLKNEIKRSVSGIELIEKGFEADVDLACELNVSSSVPVLRNGSYYELK